MGEASFLTHLDQLLSSGCGCSQPDAVCSSSRGFSLLQQVLPLDAASPEGSLAGWRLFSFLETGREEEDERWEA